MAAGSLSVGALVAAFLLPPLGVYLVRGLGASFWISVLLTLIGWIPGVIHAAIVVLGSRQSALTPS